MIGCMFIILPFSDLKFDRLTNRFAIKGLLIYLSTDLANFKFFILSSRSQKISQKLNKNQLNRTNN